jgi:4-diphosphocytidyl-2-C-methyl-D-erythritol kinase
MHVRYTDTTVEVSTPAKVNLLLEVLHKRSDGYHEIETVIAAITIFDSLVFTPLRHEEFKLRCRWACGMSADESAGGEIPDGPENLVWRAVALLQVRAGLKRGAKIDLVKRIPLAAGLGGASSDAAAALVAANKAWQLGWSLARLMELAAELGSDVPFFLTKGAAICRGRGERIESLSLPRIHLVIVRPPVGLSTPDVYRACTPTGKGDSAAGLVKAIQRGDAAAAGKRLRNNLQPAAAGLTPWIDRLKGEFEKLGVLCHQMSGSGSSYFGLCRSARQARRLAARLRAREIGTVFAATTSSAGMSAVAT